MKTGYSKLNGEGWAGQYVYDDGRRLVGVEVEQQCCEDFASFIWSDEEGFDEASAVFAEPFKEDYHVPDEALAEAYEFLEEIDHVAYHLVDGQGRKGLLVIANQHNGFYTHSYAAYEDGQMVESGAV